MMLYLACYRLDIQTSQFPAHPARIPKELAQFFFGQKTTTTTTKGRMEGSSTVFGSGCDKHLHSVIFMKDDAKLLGSAGLPSKPFGNRN